METMGVGGTGTTGRMHETENGIYSICTLLAILFIRGSTFWTERKYVLRAAQEEERQYGFDTD